MQQESAMQQETTLSRRTFVAAAGATAVALATSAPAAPARADETAYTCDLVVVGAGMAGISACLEAVDQGLSVVLVEAASMLGGTLFGTEGMFGLGSQIHIDQSTELPTKLELVNEELAFSNYRTDPLLWGDVFDAAGDDVDWLMGKGAIVERVDNYLGQSAYDTFHWWDGGNGATTAMALGETVTAGGVTVLLSTTATALKVADGRVCGVTAQAEDGSTVEIAAKAVVLACGGMANNLELLGEKAGMDLSTSVSLFPGCNVGDGQRLALAAGAKETPVCMMNVFTVKGYTATDPISVGATLQPTALIVNGDGDRFMQEDLQITKFFALVSNSWSAQDDVFCVFDAAFAGRMETEGCICGVAAVHAGDLLEGFAAQLDEAAATEDPDVFKADTVEELAEAAGIDPARLTATVARYNSLVAAGADEDFGKDPQYLTATVEQGPFYAVRPSYAVFASIGGVAVDRSMRVVDEAGAPIAGLYSAGTTSCGLYKETYCYAVSGGMNAYCCYSGRTAARTAAAELAELAE